VARKDAVAKMAEPRTALRPLDKARAFQLPPDAPAEPLSPPSDSHGQTARENTPATPGGYGAPHET
jgi:hypothetical protein